MKTTKQRVINIIGQLNGINKMLLNDEDCLVVINQLKAIKSAVSSLMEVVVESKFNNCLEKVGVKDKITVKKLFAEIIKK